MFKNVTDNQGLGLAKMARAKGVPREKWAVAEEDGTLGRILDGIKVGLPGGLLAMPPLARIHSVRVRNLQLDREWWEALSVVGGLHSDREIFRAGHLYLPTYIGVVEEEEHILLNCSIGSFGLKDALAWAAQLRLTPNDPRRVLEMVRQEPHLDRILKRSWHMSVVAPVTCTFEGYERACSVSWCVDEAVGPAGLYPVGNFQDDTHWYSFRK